MIRYFVKEVGQEMFGSMGSSAGAELGRGGSLGWCFVRGKFLLAVGVFGF